MPMGSYNRTSHEQPIGLLKHTTYTKLLALLVYCVYLPDGIGVAAVVVQQVVAGCVASYFVG